MDTPTPTDDGKRTQQSRRRNLRVGVAVLRLSDEGARRTFFGYATNLSRGGMFIRSENPRLPGEKFQVEVSLPSPINQKVCCSCEVVWKRMHSAEDPHPAGMGLRFVDLSEDVGEVIEAWARQCKELE